MTTRDTKSQYCDLHGLYHINDYADVYLKTRETTPILKFSNGGSNKFGSLVSVVQIYNSQCQYEDGLALQMIDPCKYGLANVSQYNFTCTDKRGIIVFKKEIKSCLNTAVHESLRLSTDGRLSEDCVCCMKTRSELNKWENLQIGSLFMCKSGNIKDVIICKWMGLVNDVECVGGQMKSWYCYGSDGSYCGIKVFECTKNYGIILRADDIEFTQKRDDTIVIDPSSFIDIESTFQIKCVNNNKLLCVGCRVKILYNKMSIDTDTIELYGEIRWMGTIDGVSCAGVELDNPSSVGMSGVICNNIVFDCKPNHGVLLISDHVELDIKSYMPSFTIGDDNVIKMRPSNVKCHGINETWEEADSDFEEDWNHPILQSKDIKKNAYVSVHIVKHYRKIDKKAKLVWFGNYHSLTMAIIEMDDIPILRSHPDIERFIPPSLMSENSLLLPIIPDYIFKYEDKESIKTKNDSSLQCFDERDVKFILNILKPDKKAYNRLFSETMSASNKKLMKCLIETSLDKIDIVKYPSVLEEVKNIQQQDIIKKSLDNCVLDNCSNEELLQLAVVALKNDYQTLFSNAIGQCTDRDMILTNGETFLTSIIKSGLPAKSIIDTLETNKFSATKSNSKCETPMMLVCSKMMVDVVEPLLRVIKDQSSQQVMCSICMDRNVNVVFGCGHNSCKECSDNIDDCHMCSKEITYRGSIFFNN